MKRNIYIFLNKFDILRINWSINQVYKLQKNINNDFLVVYNCLSPTHLEHSYIFVWYCVFGCIRVVPFLLSLLPHTHNRKRGSCIVLLFSPQVTSHPVLVVFITVISHRWCLVIKCRSWNFKCQLFCKILYIGTVVDDCTRQWNMLKVQTCISS